MNIFNASEIRLFYRAGRCSQGEALRLLTFHHGMTYIEAFKYITS